MRGFIKEGQKDITTWITAENEMVTSISGLDIQGPGIENIQAIEDCELLALNLFLPEQENFGVSDAVCF